MPHKKALSHICTPFGRWKVSTVVNVLIVLETLWDSFGVAVHLMDRRRWRKLADEIEMLPLSVRIGVTHGTIMIAILWALESGPADYRLTDTVLLGAASYIATYCLAVLAGKPARVRRPRAHWVGENVITEPGRK